MWKWLKKLIPHLEFVVPIDQILDKKDANIAELNAELCKEREFVSGRLKRIEELDEIVLLSLKELEEKEQEIRNLKADLKEVKKKYKKICIEIDKKPGFWIGDYYWVVALDEAEVDAIREEARA